MIIHTVTTGGFCMHLLAWLPVASGNEKQMYVEYSVVVP